MFSRVYSSFIPSFIVYWKAKKLFSASNLYLEYPYLFHDQDVKIRKKQENFEHKKILL